MATPTESILARRAPFKTAQGRRIRTLFRAFMAKVKAEDPLHVAMALLAAELTVAAENARAQLLAGDLAAEQPTVRLKNSARRGPRRPEIHRERRREQQAVGPDVTVVAGENRR